MTTLWVRNYISNTCGLLTTTFELLLVSKALAFLHIRGGSVLTITLQARLDRSRPCVVHQPLKCLSCYLNSAVFHVGSFSQADWWFSCWILMNTTKTMHAVRLILNTATTFWVFYSSGLRNLNRKLVDCWLQLCRTVATNQLDVIRRRTTTSF